MSQSRTPGRFARPHPTGFTQSAIDGLQLSWVNVTTVQIATGLARDVDDASNIQLLANLNVVITASGINGLDTGSEATGTWYSVWVVSGPSGTGSLLSTHATAPTLPAGYASAKRRIGWVYNHSDGDIQNFVQTGSGRERTIWHNENGADYLKILDSGSATSWTVLDASARVPPTADQVGVWAYSTAGSANAVRLKPIDYMAADSGTLSWAVVAQSQSRYENVWMPCPGNKEIRYKCESSGCDAFVLIQGWRETV